MNSFTEQVHLRAATSDDIPAIQAVDMAAGKLFDATGLIDEGPDGQQPVPTDVLEAGVESGFLWVAVYEPDHIVGFVLYRKQSPDLYLEQISVDPAVGRRGLGARLTQKAIDMADDLRLRGVILSTFRDVRWNGPFYARQGFEEIPRDQMRKWMFDLEDAQSLSMDVKLRCFMRRPGRFAKNWIRLPSGEKNSSNKPVAEGQKT